MHPVTLRSDRLTLSPPGVDDIDALYEACQDPEIPRYTTVPSPYTREHAAVFVGTVAEQWSAGTHLTWSIRREGRLVGSVGLYRLDGLGAAELGYWIAAPERGNGLLREAAAAVVDWGFDPAGLALARIEWRAVVGNVASARAARALGFRFEGTLRAAIRNAAGRRSDGWIAGLLADDERTPADWPVLS